MMVFHSQLEAVERPTPRERIGSGKISPACTMSHRSDEHATGEMKEMGNRTKIEIGWKRLTDHDPGTWTPCGGKEEDVNGDEGDLGIDSRDVVCNVGTSGVEVGFVEADGDTNDGNQELAKEHTKSTPTAGKKPSITRL